MLFSHRLRLARCCSSACRRLALAAPDLANVRELYAAASYAEALEVLGGLEGADNTEAVEQYRALCLLGLGRTADAEQALERIVMRRPLYVVPAAEVSPRLVTLYHDVRRRSLPGATRQVYARAKASYDAKDHKVAAEQFKDVARTRERPGRGRSGCRARRVEAAGRRIPGVVGGRLVAAAPPPPPALPPPPVADGAKAPSMPRVYTAADADVVRTAGDQSADAGLETAEPRSSRSDRSAACSR